MTVMCGCSSLISSPSPGAGDTVPHRSLGSPAMSEAFYLLDGDDVLSTEWTRGPWDEGAQHGGPPAALLGRAIERLEPVGELQMVRVTVELLRPIPIDRLRVHARVLRPGYKVQFAEATLRSGDREVARATAWRMRTNDVTRDSIGLESPTFPDPEGLPSLDIDVLGDGPSYFRALEWRFSNGTF